jgi:hypothetical protein
VFNVVDGQQPQYFSSLDYGVGGTDRATLVSGSSWHGAFSINEGGNLTHCSSGSTGSVFIEHP